MTKNELCRLREATRYMVRFLMRMGMSRKDISEAARVSTVTVNKWSYGHCAAVDGMLEILIRIGFDHAEAITKRAALIEDIVVSVRAIASGIKPAPKV